MIAKIVDSREQIPKNCIFEFCTQIHVQGSGHADRGRRYASHYSINHLICKELSALEPLRCLKIDTLIFGIPGYIYM